MQADLDMSGRIEETSRPTVLALANGLTASIRITAREKRKVLNALRQHRSQWSRTLVNVYVFSVLVYLVLRDHIEKMSLVIIDLEYSGYEAVIKNRVLTLCRRQGVTVYKDQITFHRVGKKSPAHILAFKVYKRLVEPDQVVTADDVLAEFGE